MRIRILAGTLLPFVFGLLSCVVVQPPVLVDGGSTGDGGVLHDGGTETGTDGGIDCTEGEEIVDGICAPTCAEGEQRDEQNNCVPEVCENWDDDEFCDVDDICPENPLNPDEDGDGVCDDGADRCLWGNDEFDMDNDGIPDACDICPDLILTQRAPEELQRCHSEEECQAPDTSVCNCPPATDPDNDGVCGDDDVCADGDDNIDTDGDNIPDACDACIDPDNDGVCGDDDVCANGDDDIDIDGDGTPDACDACIDPDNDGVCGVEDICPMGDDGIDIDNDMTPDDCDDCVDIDADEICIEDDICPVGPDPVVGDTLRKKVKYRYYEANVGNSLEDWFGGSPGTAPISFTTEGLLPNMQSPNINNAKERDDLFVFDLEGTIVIPNDGDWTFSTRSDDGSRLYIDEIYVVNNDYVQGATERSGTINLSAGTHTIRVQFFELYGGHTLNVSWQGPGTEYANIPDSAFVDIEPISPCTVRCGDGIVESFEGCDDGNRASGDGCSSSCTIESGAGCSVSVLGKVYYELYHPGYSTTLQNWFSGAPGNAAVGPSQNGFITNVQKDDIDAAHGVTQDYFFDMQGVLNIPAGGDWTFYTNSNDGSRLFIDGMLVVANDGYHFATERKGTIALNAGTHTLQVQYFQAGGDSVMHVSWSGPDTPYEPIPDTAFEDIQSTSSCFP